ncbi:MmgE/PrpD family protein [Novosphingobium malaysiense]|uniref:MmgE/PrpD family protein n=1 Tax=Novosphingobium malaysiense TaxID=1348853 RepID=UPI00068AC383|nr:MmgE/PrpD family protein [Novosphingobium malaysiense]
MDATPAISQVHGLTRQLASFATASAVPELAREAARRAIVDTIGVVLAGRGEPPVALLGATLDGGREALSLGLGRILRAPDAALADGMAGHVLDYDDVARHGHPSVVIVPALFAEAQRLRASGKALLDACAVGQEVWADLARRETGAYHMGSWHPTSVLGVVAAAAALCRLHGLDTKGSSNAIALAASFAGGLIASFGTHAKPLQAGRAAASAIEAVALAQAGLTGSDEALESEHGLLQGISSGGNVDCHTPMRAASDTWQFLEDGLSVKRYPVCYASHRAIDATLAIAEREGFTAKDVLAITASVGPAPAATINNASPANGLEARFSLQHNLAAAIIDREVGFAQLTDAFVQRADVAALCRLTRIDTIAGDCPDQPGMARCDRVVIETHDGRTIDSGPIRRPRGHARLPLSDDELDAKFLDCARHGGVAEPERVLRSLHRLGNISDMREELAQW